MKRTWKPTVAGILDIIMGLPSSVFVGAGIFDSLFGNDGGSGELSLLACFWIPFAILPLVGGICALRRRAWGLALAGSILALPIGYLFSQFFYRSGELQWFLPCGIPIAAIILIAMSKKEFTRPS